MRWTNENWQTVRNKVVRMNTLTAGVPPMPKARVGVVQTVTPTMNGVKLRVAYRHNGEWTENYFTTKPTLDPLHGPTPMIPVLEGSAQEAVLRAFYKKNLAATLKGVDKGFSGSLGADPEIFAVTADNVVLPAWEFLPEKGKGVEVFWDGFQAEFTTKTETCLAWFLDHVRTGLLRVRKAAKAKGGELALTDVIAVPQSILESADEKHVRFGCEPSKNAYNDFGQLDAKCRELEIRFGGGHKHFGDQVVDDEYIAIPIVKALDAIWGVASVSMFEGLECPLRRVYYGKAGEYRLPPHGLEYRTPSNAWLCHPAIAQLSWTLARQAYYIGRNLELAAVWDADETEVRRVINELDVAGARKILQRNKAALTALLKGYYAENHSRMPGAQFENTKQFAVKHGVNVILEGAVKVLEAPKDLVRNWMLEAPTDGDRWYVPADEEARKTDTTWHQHTETGNSQWLVAAAAIERGERI
jgi:hypothetical protein